ncbi:DNA/RNA helicase domain-containing protein [Streptosporangium sp. H16]|uniref:DNA/RNA helicase domain-containing protein n=1 Tax=Streptosporangium sp. H16 TaxID=3444184 RepID=UPI003F790C98
MEDPEAAGRLRSELADVMVYLTRLADVLNVDLVAAAHAKLDQSEQRYSVEAYRGSARKACWPWSKPNSDDTLVHDVRIGDWSRPWNVKEERAVGSAPASALWATLDGGFEQVGCVYAAQGFEYDWNGVIIGPDLVVRDGRLHARRAFSKDPALTRGTTGEQADRPIRNTYKVLLTRGMIGTFVYSTDPETQEFLSRLTS